MRGLRANFVGHKEQGAVLLTTLLVMSIMAVLAVAMIDDVRFGVKRAVNVEGRAQAAWYARGAEDYALAYLTQQLRTTKAADLNQLLREPQTIILPIEGGTISLSLRDGSQCASISALDKTPARRQFNALLVSLGWERLAAANMTSIAADWQDADSQILPGGAEDYGYLGLETPYRTANIPFTSVMEMRALHNMTEDDYQNLRPFICARPGGEQGKVNVNTLAAWQAPLLASLLGEDSYQLALQVITQRPATGYADIEAFKTAPALSGVELKNIDLDALAFEPGHIWVEAEITFGDTAQYLGTEFDISDGQPKQISRSYNRETIRPVLLNSDGLGQKL